jgi:HD-GYP domain-containing protein (c-di-GMP phosphodiesterase class II)
MSPKMCLSTVMFSETAPIYTPVPMNYDGEMQPASPACPVSNASAVCDPVVSFAPPGSLPALETPALWPLPSGETKGVLFALAQVVEQRDKHTAGHSERLAYSAVALGVAMRLDTSSLLALYVGGYLHDVGKVGIPDSILFKTGKLTDEEWKLMRTHPVRGEEICRPLKSLAGVLPLIRHHHERWDGTGYPDGLRGTEIPLLARVLQTVDIYDALTNPRSYKHAYSNALALEILQEEAARGWRDPDVTELFVRRHKNMLAKIAGYRPTFDQPLAEMADSLRSLQAFLAN